MNSDAGSEKEQWYRVNEKSKGRNEDIKRPECKKDLLQLLSTECILVCKVMEIASIYRFILSRSLQKMKSDSLKIELNNKETTLRIINKIIA